MSSNAFRHERRKNAPNSRPQHTLINPRGRPRLNFTNHPQTEHASRRARPRNTEEHQTPTVRAWLRHGSQRVEPQRKRTKPTEKLRSRFDICSSEAKGECVAVPYQRAPPLFSSRPVQKQTFVFLISLLLLRHPGNRKRGLSQGRLPRSTLNCSSPPRASNGDRAPSFERSTNQGVRVGLTPHARKKERKICAPSGGSGTN